MLSLIGRAATRRVVVGAPRSTNRVLQSTWQFQRADAGQNVGNASERPRFSASLRRSYATATKSAPKAKPAAKSTTTVKPTAKKAAAKKTAKKAAPKKKKSAAKKPAAKKKKLAGKILTPEQQLKNTVKRLRELALSPPKKDPETAYNLFVADTFKGGSLGETKAIDAIKECSQRFKSLSPQDLEALNHRAAQNKARNEVAFKKWIEGYTPDEIRIANNARNQLKHKDPSKRIYRQLADARQPKRPTMARLHFAKERFASGDLKGISIGDCSAMLVKEWNALSASEKKPYEETAAADKQRYFQEFLTAYKRESPGMTTG